MFPHEQPCERMLASGEAKQGPSGMNEVSRTGGWARKTKLQAQRSQRKKSIRETRTETLAALCPQGELVST